MITVEFNPRPVRLLLTAIVLGLIGIVLVTRGMRLHIENDVTGGVVFLVLSVFCGFYGLRWACRFIKEFLS